MRKIIFWTTIACAGVAAYLMFKRGVPAGEIATEIIQHPVGTLMHELSAS